MLYNHMYDVGFTLLSPYKNGDLITRQDLIRAAKKRLSELETIEDTSKDEVFGECDAPYEVEESVQSLKRYQEEQELLPPEAVECYIAMTQAQLHQLSTAREELYKLKAIIQRATRKTTAGRAEVAMAYINQAYTSILQTETFLYQAIAELKQL